MAKPATIIVGETFTSISLQIKRLIIASELQEDEMKLKRTADAVRVLSSHMVKMVQRVIACLKEEDAQVQVARSCDRICVAADSLVVASQMVDISGSGFRRCGSLVDQATVLHEATVELLKVASIVGASSVARCSQNIHPALNSLLSARDPNDLEELARNYSEVVSCFENDVNEMSVLICEAVNFQAVSSSIDALKKSIPLLNASLKTLLTYREIEEAQVSRNNVVGLVLSSLDSLSNALHEKNQNWPLISYSSLEVKQFTAVCNEMKLIATRKSMSSQDLTDLDVQLNHVVQYAMDLAAEAGKESKSNIFKSCSTLMENQNKISQQSQSSLHSALHDGKYSVSVSTEWSHLQIDCLSRLQVEVVKTLPKVIISFLIKDHTKPVFDLLKALKERNHSKDLLPEAKEPATSSGDKLQFCADQFRVELNDFCTGMRLIVAGANLNPTDGREMRQSICTAEKLGKRILLEMEKLLRSNDLGRSDWHPGSLETDCDDWCILADDLLGNTDKLVDAVEGLLMLCGEMIWKMVSSHSHSSKDEALDESVVLMTRRFIRLSAKVNDKHLDGWLRSGLRRKIAALEHDLSELKRSDGLERWRCGTGSDTTCFYRLLQQSVSDICWCVKTGRLTKDPHEEPISVVRTAFDSLIDDALNESTSTELKESEVNFDLLTSLGLHGSAFCEIKEIIDSLIFGAVSGSAGAEMRPGRLLFTSSHILHSALLVLGTVEQKDRKRSFILDKLAELADFVPMILDEADMIRSFRKYDLERLYELGEKLCHTMSLLINFVDDILLRWNPLPQNLVIAAMAGDWSLLKRETEELNHQIEAVMHLTSLAKDEEETLEFEDEDFKALTTTDSLKEFIEEVESLSYRIMSSTGKMNSKSGGRNDFIPELRILLRDWSTRVFFLNARLDRLSTRYVDSDYSWKERLLWMRQENDRLQNEIRCSSDGENETAQLLDDLSCICDQMDDLAKRSDHLFLSQKLTLLSSQWTSKVRRLENRRKDGTPSIGSGRQSLSTGRSSTSIENEKMEEMPLDGKKHKRDGPSANDPVPRITGDEHTFRQIKQTDCSEKYLSGRPVTEFSPESDKILQSPLGGSSKNVKNQVSPVFKTRRFLGYKKDDSAYATSGSIVDCILEMSKAAYQLKDHLRDQRESFGNLTVSKDHATSLLAAIQRKEEKVVQVAGILINCCLDERLGDDVRLALQHVQSILSQLYILVGVKMAVDDTYTEDKNLKTLIQRLLESLNNLKRGFEAVCVKGLKQSSSEEFVNNQEIRAMARWWKSNWIQSLNSRHADTDELGLRTSKNYLPPQTL